MYGGGTQSIAIAALIVQGKIPIPDWAVIADTGREKQSTWDYLNFLQPKLPFHIHRVSKADYATVDLWRGDTLLIPAFSNQSGEVAKLGTYCSNEWKTRVCHRWLRRVHNVPVNYQKWIGFSFDEPKRWMKMRESQPTVRFPLVDDVECTRAACVSIVHDMGWPEPPRSSCWMCPLMKDDEWLSLPLVEFNKAVVLDREIRIKDPNAFLHRQCVPLDQVKFKSSTDEPRACDSGVCFA